MNYSKPNGGFQGLGFHELGSHVLVPFAVRRLPRAHVVWLNERWCIQSGMNILDGDVRRRFCRELTSKFGVRSITCEEANQVQSKVQRILYADRYGDTGGTLFGGSGRCGGLGQFIAKGIGRTPLAANRVDWEHRHGFMWLDEAIRETISSEVANAELPYGAVPVVAIIDTGLSYDGPEVPTPRRSAILIRPNFVRPAHFERSIYFGAAGNTASDQYRDALRVRDAVTAAASKCGNRLNIEAELKEIFLRYARQIGAGRALRLWTKRFLSGNSTIDGRSVDLSVFRAVPNWCALEGVPGERFGDDVEGLLRTFKSVSFYFAKYAKCGNTTDTKPLEGELEREIDKLFVETNLHAFGLGGLTGSDLYLRLAAELQNYFDAQQKMRFRDTSALAEQAPWLTDDSATPDGGAALNASLARVSRRIRDLLAEARGAGISLSQKNIDRYLRPRKDLFYVALKKSVEEFVQNHASRNEALGISLEIYVAGVVEKARRYWRHLPPSFEITGFANGGHSSAVYGWDATGNAAWIEAQLIDEKACVFGTQVDVADLRETRSINLGKTAYLYVPLDGSANPEAKAHSVSLGSTIVRIPAAGAVY